MINKITYVLILLMLISIIKSLYRLKITNDILKKKFNKCTRVNDIGGKRKINIIIPVYMEQEIIIDSLNHFYNISEQKNLQIIYVTTRKEVCSITTRNIIEKYIIEKKISKKNIKVMDYPKKDGIMAHQINYACNSISDDEIIMIYNVDSRISGDIIDYLNDNFEEEVFYQQPAAYPMDEYHHGVMKSAISWQNRWTLAYEIPKWENKKYRYMYTIGHGVAFSKKLYKKFGGYSEKFWNEDNILGFKLKQKKIRIELLPFFEKADSTESIIKYIKQQSVWFRGPFLAFNYYLKYRKNNFKDLILAIENFKASISWIMWPLITILSLTILKVYDRYLLMLIIFILSFLYSSIINRISFEMIKNYISTVKKTNLIIDYIYFLLRCLGPIYCICNMIFKNNTKYKTEKRSKAMEGKYEF